MAKHELWELQSMQAAPLNVKVLLTKQRIRDWVKEYGRYGVYVSFSGGKDSTVLLHLVREMYGDSIPAVYCNTGLEYPEITQFVKTFDNVTIIKPKMNFFQVCEKYGFPLISKEVSECVSGARKYLKNVLTSMIETEIALTDRQTDRQTDRARSGITRSIVSYADQASIAKNSRGGWTGSIGNSEESESSVQSRMAETQQDRQIWQAIQQCKVGGGGEAIRFAKLTGVFTAQNTIDARLYKNYRQFESPTSDGDKQSTGQSDDGDYP